jgi:hypothetical protein
MEFIAGEAVRFLCEQIAVGGLQKLGGDAFSKLLQKLKGLLDYKLAGKPELEQAQEQPEILEAVIVEEFRKDPSFYNNLQELVTQLREAEKERSDINQNTNNFGQMGDVVAGDNVGGDKFTGDKVGGDKFTGDKVLGDKFTGHKFRRSTH